MMDMEILSQMIKGTALVSLQDKYGKPLVRLCEPQMHRFQCDHSQSASRCDSNQSRRLSLTG